MNPELPFCNCKLDMARFLKSLLSLRLADSVRVSTGRALICGFPDKGEVILLLLLSGRVAFKAAGRCFRDLDFCELEEEEEDVIKYRA